MIFVFNRFIYSKSNDKGVHITQFWGENFNLLLILCFTNIKTGESVYLVSNRGLTIKVVTIILIDLNLFNNILSM